MPVLVRSAMSNANFDYAVIGSGLLARLVAVLLASEHGKRVMLAGRRRSAFQLPREFAVAAEVITRPESLRLLQVQRDETVRLVNGLGKGLVERADVMFVAETPESIAALGHFRHLARAMKWQAEPASDPRLPGASLTRLRDVTRLAEARLESLLEDRLQALGVSRLSPSGMAIGSRRDSGVAITSGKEEVTVDQVLLADDAAVLAHGPAAALRRYFVEVPVAALLIEDGIPLAAQIMAFIDRGLSLSRGDHGSAHVLATGDLLNVEARVGATLADDKPVRRAGDARFVGLLTADGAPFVGQVKGDIHAVAGLGAVGPFFAPLVARMLAGVSTSSEKEWLAKRGVVRQSERALAIDYRAALP